MGKKEKELTFSRWMEKGFKMVGFELVLNAKLETEKKRGFGVSLTISSQENSNVKIQRNKSASENRILIEWSQIIKGIN